MASFSMGMITYDLKRRILMTLTTIYFVTGIALCYAAWTIIYSKQQKISDMIANGNFLNPDSNAFYGMIMIFNILLGEFAQIIGFLGAWRENLCLSIFYITLMFIMGITSIIEAIHEWIVWFILTVWFFCFLVELTFVRDLRKKQKAAQREDSVSVCSSDVSDRYQSRDNCSYIDVY